MIIVANGISIPVEHTFWRIMGVCSKVNEDSTVEVCRVSSPQI